MTAACSLRRLLTSLTGMVLIGLTGCAATYRSVVRPRSDLGTLDPALMKFTSSDIEDAFKARPRPSFPADLAVAKVGPGSSFFQDDAARFRHGFCVRTIPGPEAEAWRKAADGVTGQPRLISQVHLLSPLLTGDAADLKRIRQAAAQLRAPLLLVYMEDATHASGYNDAAMLYWTLVGLFLVPGNSVGHYTTYNAVLLDTRTGLALATAQGEGKKEENVLPGAVSIADDRVRRTAAAEAFAGLQSELPKMLTGVVVANATNGP